MTGDDRGRDIWGKVVVRLFIVLALLGGIAAPTTVKAQNYAALNYIGYCNQYHGTIEVERYADVAASIETNGEQKSLAYELTYTQKNRRECLEYARGMVKADPVLVEKINQLIATSDKFLADGFAAARSKFEADVVKYLNPARYFGEPNLDPYRAALASAEKLPNFRSMCGMFDFTRVPVERAAVDAARARHEAFKTCFKKFQSAATKISVNEFGTYQVAAKRLAGTLPYTCAQWKRPNCVPDTEWKRFGGELFTQARRAKVDAAEKRLDADQKLAYDTERKVNEWVRELSDRINAVSG